MLLSLLVFFSRVLLGFFLSSLLAAVLYFVAVVVVLSVTFSYVDLDLMGTSSVGAGTGAGAFLAWRLDDVSRKVLALTLVMSLAAGILGGWGALLHRGADPLYTPGGYLVPRLGAVYVGAMLGGNLPHVVFGVVQLARRPRI